MTFLVPFFLVLASASITLIEKGSLPKAPHLDDLIAPIGFIASIGFVGGSFIWALGVRGNPLFGEGTSSFYLPYLVTTRNIDGNCTPGGCFYPNLM